MPGTNKIKAITGFFESKQIVILVNYAKEIPPTCTVFPVSHEFVSRITLALDPFGTQEIDVAIEVTFAKQAILRFLNARLRTSTVAIAAQLGILCCRYKTKRGNCCCCCCCCCCFSFIFLPFPKCDTCIQGQYKIK